MTDDEVLDEARAEEFELVERMSAGQWAVGWARGADDRWPCFLEERQAMGWMRDRSSRRRVFVEGSADRQLSRGREASTAEAISDPRPACTGLK
jgi:hypothetical protein